MLFWRIQKIVQLNTTTKPKNAVTLIALDLTKKKFWWLKEIRVSFF